MANIKGSCLKTHLLEVENGREEEKTMHSAGIQRTTTFLRGTLSTSTSQLQPHHSVQDTIGPKWQKVGRNGFQCLKASKPQATVTSFNNRAEGRGFKSCLRGSLDCCVSGHRTVEQLMTLLT